MILFNEVPLIKRLKNLSDNFLKAKPFVKFYLEIKNGR